MNGSGNSRHENTGATARLWTTNVEATFEADNAEDAEAIAERISERVFAHPQVWSVEAHFDVEQRTETVDV